MNSLKRFLLTTFALGLFLSATVSHAIVTIDIERGISRGIPIAIVPFGGKELDASKEPLDQIISNDLYRTGQFAPRHPRDFLNNPTSHEQIKFADWHLIEVDFLVIGSIERVENQTMQIRFQLFDVFEESQIIGLQYTIPEDQYRKLAHQISNTVFERITGRLSSFDSQILYTTRDQDAGGGNIYRLFYADYDGYNPREILNSKFPILSPKWSPDSSEIAYVVVGRGKSTLYLQNIKSGQRRLVPNLSGLPRAPAWSPDGKKIAFSLSHQGNSEIYVLSLETGNLTRITKNQHIDTEPAWSPVGDELVFTSGRSAGPQLYIVKPDGQSRPKRLTLEGRYNAGAQFSHDGKRLILISNQGDGNRVSLFDIKKRLTFTVSNTNLDDSPSFSPHSDMVMYIREGGDRKLVILSPDGTVNSEIPVVAGQVMQAQWETNQ